MSLTLQVKYTPHKGQKEFHKSKARFRVLACGRRWGKTISGANEVIKQTVEAGEDAIIFCVAPTFWHTQKQWREFLRFCPKELITAVHRGEHKITLHGNRQVWFRSADNPDSLRSEGIDVLWVDEGGQIKEEAWTLALRPALMDKRGSAIFTGTPKGKNWYFRIFTRGEDSNQPDYESWTFPSSNNPYINPDEIAEFARDMPKLAYQQEILGVFIDDVGSVFRQVNAKVKGSLEPHTPAKQYVMGADFGKFEDFTVFCVVDDVGHVCGWERFGEIDWVLQRRRLVNMANKYSARVVVDASGVGDPVFDELKRENIRVEGFKFTNASKKDLIENLSMMMDNELVTYPEIPELINELKLFGYTVGSTGLVRYGAPEGYHDDCVIALALACWQIRKPRGFVII